MKMRQMTDAMYIILYNHIPGPSKGCQMVLKGVNWPSLRVYLAPLGRCWYIYIYILCGYIFDIFLYLWAARDCFLMFFVCIVDTRYILHLSLFVPFHVYIDVQWWTLWALPCEVFPCPFFFFWGWAPDLSQLQLIGWNKTSNFGRNACMWQNPWLACDRTLGF